MKIPTVEQCARLMDTYGMLDNIRHHSLVVARLADRLVTGLTGSAPLSRVPNRKLVIAGALLHDIAKTPCLDGSCEHSREGAVICTEEGYPEVAEIVAEHVLLQSHEPERFQTGHFHAKELVYYADKRVRHAHVVSLEERLEYILEHYGRDDPTRHRLIAENFSKCQVLEEHLFTFLPFSPAMLGSEEATRPQP